MRSRSDHARCPAEATLQLISGKWKVLILWLLLNRPRLRFSELRRAIPACTAKMLTQQLREMERDGLLTRTIYAEIPPRVEYSLTRFGRSLRPVVDAMCRWGGACSAPRSRPKRAD
jgi:DNA-binding HxlR family transcriptional regulator